MQVHRVVKLPQAHLYTLLLLFVLSLPTFAMAQQNCDTVLKYSRVERDVTQQRRAVTQFADQMCSESSAGLKLGDIDLDFGGSRDICKARSEGRLDESYFRLVESYVEREAFSAYRACLDAAKYAAGTPGVHVWYTRPSPTEIYFTIRSVPPFNCRLDEDERYTCVNKYRININVPPSHAYSGSHCNFDKVNKENPHYGHAKGHLAPLDFSGISCSNANGPFMIRFSGEPDFPAPSPHDIYIPWMPTDK